jgi:hypothetical protein
MTCEIEAVIQRRYDAGKVGPIDLFESRAERLRAEIDLLRCRDEKPRP